MPLVAVGLFYREGYFRQMLDADGAQLEIYAVNSRESLPVRLVDPLAPWCKRTCSARV